MMVNVSIFETEAGLNEMVIAFEQVLDEMAAKYCVQGHTVPAEPIPEDEQTCDLEEINAAREFITDIDVIISDNLFKGNDDDARKNAMIGIIELKSAMDDRVRALYNNGATCLEEISKIKN